MKKNILALFIIMLITISLVGCGNKGSGYIDGEYEGVGMGNNGNIKVSVLVKSGKIADVKVIEHEESEGISDAAMEQTPKDIVSKNSTEVDSIAGATYSSEGIKEAVNNALEGAKQ